MTPENLTPTTFFAYWGLWYEKSTRHAQNISCIEVHFCLYVLHFQDCSWHISHLYTLGIGVCTIKSWDCMMYTFSTRSNLLAIGTVNYDCLDAIESNINFTEEIAMCMFCWVLKSYNMIPVPFLLWCQMIHTMMTWGIMIDQYKLCWKWHCNDVVMMQQNGFVVEITKKCDILQHFSFFVHVCGAYQRKIKLSSFYFFYIFEFLGTRGVHHEKTKKKACSEVRFFAPKFIFAVIFPMWRQNVMKCCLFCDATYFFKMSRQTACPTMSIRNDSSQLIKQNCLDLKWSLCTNTVY